MERNQIERILSYAMKLNIGICKHEYNLHFQKYWNKNNQIKTLSYSFLNQMYCEYEKLLSLTLDGRNKQQYREWFEWLFSTF
jgi:hypothetical protein